MTDKPDALSSALDALDVTTEAYRKALAPDAPLANLGTCGRRANQFDGLSLSDRQAEDMQAHLRAVDDKMTETMTWLFKACDRARQLVGDETEGVIAELAGLVTDALGDTIAPALADLNERLEQIEADAELPGRERRRMERIARGEERE